MPDDGVSDDHSVTFRLAEGSEAVPDGDLKDQTCEHQPRTFPKRLSALSAGPASPWPPARTAFGAMCPHLHSKVDTNPPLKQVTVKRINGNVCE